MCLLMVKPANIPLPSNMDEICELAYDANPDGSGFCTQSVHWRSHVVKPKDFLAALHKNIRDEDAAIIHWRWGSSGGIKRGNCHPFHIRDGSMFAHNGVISNVYKPTKVDCDTLILAKTAIDYDDLKVRCEFLVGKGANKFALMRKGDNKVEIIGEEHGHWLDDGCWYSNMMWSYTCTDTIDMSDMIDAPFAMELLEEFSTDYIGLEEELVSLTDKYGYDAVCQVLYLLKAAGK